uniref:Rubrerythrin n=1 Tax=Cyanophora biloba TaxID=1489483 RepID=A0A2Z4HG99_9EUKA|nr:rubrerythrin [Cyanophora biloba]AWW13817.1 rubrerythrin [Cyanophora biloba]
MGLNYNQEDFMGLDRFFQDAVSSSNTNANAASSIEVEMYECDCMYPTFAEIARRSGQPEIGAMFDAIAKEEGMHAQLLTKLYAELEVKDSAETLEAKRLVSTIEAQIDAVASDSRGLRRALETALEVETIESQKTYPAFAKLAAQQGQLDVAEAFDAIVKSETKHANWVKRALENLLEVA